jgi:hypothetical protein
MAAAVVLGATLMSTAAEAAPRPRPPCTSPTQSGCSPIYTHASTLKRECPIHANYPKAGVPDWGWSKPARSPAGNAYHVGVRYTVNAAYAMVLDPERGDAVPQVNPHWGFIARACLDDPSAYHFTTRLEPRHGVDGKNRVKRVPLAPPRGARGKTIRVNGYGTLRSAAQSFPIGNVRDGDPFRITTSTCGRHSREAWIFGEAPKSGRWGWVQAGHLPGCT